MIGSKEEPKWPEDWSDQRPNDSYGNICHSLSDAITVPTNAKIQKNWHSFPQLDPCGDCLRAHQGPPRSSVSSRLPGQTINKFS